MVHKNTDTFLVEIDKLDERSGVSLVGFISVLLLCIAALGVLFLIQGG